MGVRTKRKRKKVFSLSFKLSRWLAFLCLSLFINFFFEKVEVYFGGKVMRNGMKWDGNGRGGRATTTQLRALVEWRVRAKGKRRKRELLSLCCHILLRELAAAWPLHTTLASKAAPLSSSVLSLQQDQLFFPSSSFFLVAINERAAIHMPVFFSPFSFLSSSSFSI